MGVGFGIGVSVDGCVVIVGGGGCDIGSGT